MKLETYDYLSDTAGGYVSVGALGK